MPEQGRVTHAHQPGVHVLRYSGRVDYTLAPAIERFAERLLQDDGGAQLVFDLTQAQLLDSTNLGLLARVAERARKCGGGRSVIVSQGGDVEEVLQSMGFDAIFDIVHETPAVAAASAGEEEVSSDRASPSELSQTVLEAHRALAGLNENGRRQFQDVVNCLEQQTRRRG